MTDVNFSIFRYRQHTSSIIKNIEICGKSAYSLFLNESESVLALHL